MTASDIVLVFMLGMTAAFAVSAALLILLYCLRRRPELPLDTLNDEPSELDGYGFGPERRR